jgi:hypothetical protein
MAADFSSFGCQASMTAANMVENKFLTAEEVSQRYRGEITVGTLRNWRAQRIGPTFVKIGKAVLYPADGLDAWDKKNTVTCRG